MSKLDGKAYISNLLFSWLFIFKNSRGALNQRRMICHTGCFKVETGASQKAKDNLIIIAKF